MNVTIYIDGLCEPTNPDGYACWAYEAHDENDKPLGRNYGCLGHGKGTSNNIAEYQALIEALKRARNEEWIGCNIRSDSQLIVKQVNGEYRCNSEHLRVLLAEAVALMKIVKATLTWIPREQNTRADHLSRVAYNKARAS